MKVSFEGIGETVATFEAETEGATAVKPGAAVTLSGNGKVCACTKDKEIPVGVALGVRGGYASVQTSGYVKLPCAAALTVGYQHVAMNTDGKLAVLATGRGCVVTDVEDGVCGVIL